MMDFDPSIISLSDFAIALKILGCMRDPDLTITPDGKPYIYRWHLVKGRECNVYFHIQVADDPRAELHDHPWDNTSVILAGGYTELLNQYPDGDPGFAETFIRKPGDVIFRCAYWSHRLLMADHPYTMTLFSTGPKVRDWGYWFPDGWHHNKRHNVLVDGVAIFKEEM